jgi:serine/threonine-protein kinase HipA
MIRVWTDNSSAGVLDRNGLRGSTFAYGPEVGPDRSVSVTMPVRLASWDTPLGVAPIFEMNLPEGALRERLRLAFAKATGSFGDLDLLTIVGRSQLGRVRFTGADDQLDEGVPFQSVDEILSSRRGGELYRYLIEKFAAYSGISGVQPKFLVRDEGTFTSDQDTKRALSPSFRGATHIVKFWDPAEFPQLAANEFFCLKAAERCGLSVPPHRLAEDGSALVMERFDLRPDGTYRGFEDFCVLNARRTDEKYRGSYETNVMKRFQQFSSSPTMLQESLQLFTLIVLNCAIRNGDAHLKNFGIVYDDVQGGAHLAPIYDLVTTAVYIPQDRMALTLNGTNQWPIAKDLIRFGEGRSLGTRRSLIQIMERIGDALSDTEKDVLTYSKEHREFAVVADEMFAQWENGRQSLTISS